MSNNPYDHSFYYDPATGHYSPELTREANRSMEVAQMDAVGRLGFAIKRIDAADAELVRLSKRLVAAKRAARLALFVINKAGIMPNDSWKAGFDKDMAIAEGE